MQADVAMVRAMRGHGNSTDAVGGMPARSDAVARPLPASARQRGGVSHGPMTVATAGCAKAPRAGSADMR